MMARLNSNISEPIPKGTIQKLLQNGYEKIDRFYDFTTDNNPVHAKSVVSTSNKKNNISPASPPVDTLANPSKEALIKMSKKALTLSIEAYLLRETTMLLLRHFEEIPSNEPIPENLIKKARQLNTTIQEFGKTMGGFEMSTTKRALTTEQHKLQEILHKISPTDGEYFV